MQPLKKKSKFTSSRKQPHVPSDYTLFLKKSNHAFRWTRDYNGIFTNIQTYSDISRQFRTLCKIAY